MSKLRAKNNDNEEESFFVSMTDLMVGMLFIFIIMLMSFALNYNKSQNELEERVEISQKTRAEMLNDIQNFLKDRGIKVEIDEKHGILHLPEDILFPSGKADLSAKGIEALGYVSNGLFEILPCYSFYKDASPSLCEKTSPVNLEAVFIEGHTDNISLARGSRYKDNWDLSAARAINTYRTILKTNPKLLELMNEQEEALLSVSGYGENRPRKSNDTNEGKRANRRIDLRFLMATEKIKEIESFADKISPEVN